jgi:hypothetical protein
MKGQALSVQGRAGHKVASNFGYSSREFTGIHSRALLTSAHYEEVCFALCRAGVFGIGVCLDAPPPSSPPLPPSLVSLTGVSNSICTPGRIDLHRQLALSEGLFPGIYGLR